MHTRAARLTVVTEKFSLLAAARVQPVLTAVHAANLGRWIGAARATGSARGQSIGCAGGRAGFTFRAVMAALSGYLVKGQMREGDSFPLGGRCIAL